MVGTDMGTVGTGAVLTIVIMISLAGVRFGYNRISSNIEALRKKKADAEVEEDVSELRDAHRETRRLAEAAYATVHGDQDRPEDVGFIVESKDRWDKLESDIDYLSDSVERLERAQERHQQKTEIILDALADEMDIDMMFRGGEADD